MPSFGPQRILSQNKGYRDRILSFLFRKFERKRYRLTGKGRHFDLCIFLPEKDAVLQKTADRIVPSGIRKQAPVLDVHTVPGYPYSDILVIIFDLRKLRIRHAVARDDPVPGKAVITRPLEKIAAIRLVLPAEAVLCPD